MPPGPSIPAESVRNTLPERPAKVRPATREQAGPSPAARPAGSSWELKAGHRLGRSTLPWPTGPQKDESWRKVAQALRRVGFYSDKPVDEP